MKLITLTALTLFSNFALGQYLLYNQGATVKIQSGATLYVEGGVRNTGTGHFDNDGTLEIKGDFLNEGTWDATNPNTLKFSGNTASTLTTVNPAVVYQDLVVQKSGANVILASHTTVNDSLVFSSAGSGKIETGNFDLKLGSAALVGGQSSTEYVATTGTGAVVKSVTANGTFAFPIGDIAFSSPLTSTYTGSGYAAATIRARANDLVHPNKPADATEFLTRYWDVTAAGISTYANTLVGTYDPSDLTLGAGGLASHVKGAVHDGTEWSFFDAAAGVNTVTGSTQDLNADFTGMNFFGKADIIVFLHGAYNTATGLMTTTLNTSGIIPLTSPYPDAPASVASIPANVTDWIKLEAREANNPTNILGRASVFLKNDGTIVGLDGTSLPIIKNANPTSIINIVHRNHLSVRTPNAGINLVSPVDYNFSNNLANAFDNPAISTNDAMRLMSNGVYTMWGGNANGNNNVRYNLSTGDEAYLLGTVLGGNTGLVITGPAAYNGADMNMNAVIRYNLSTGDEAFLLGNALSGNTGLVLTQHQ